MKALTILRENEEMRTLLLTIISGIVLGLSFFKLIPGLPFDIAWVAILISGIPIVYGAIKGLVTEFDVTADVLVAIALVAAVAIGEWFAAGEVAFIMQLGKVLEDVTAGRSRKSLEALIKLSPQKASLRTPDGEREIDIAEVKIGNILLVRAGESIPVDGIIIRGQTAINQAVMTGESVPVDKAEGDEVYQGTLNQTGVIEIQATKVGEDSSLQKMILLVKEAEENKAPIVRIADKWARILVPVALVCALVIWIVTQDIHRAVTALVVFCPCSLILATPTAMMAAIGVATKHGILIKSGAAVETLSKVDTFVMDKTGTLTSGKLQVELVGCFDHAWNERNLLQITADAEKLSEHPLGKAIVAHAQSQGMQINDPQDFQVQMGKGVVATVSGKKVAVGEKAIGTAILEKSPEDYARIKELEQRGKTVLPVAIDGKLAGFVSIADSLRPESASTISSLKNAGLSRIVMLTGDNQAVATTIGQAAGVTDVIASQLPEGKVNSIKSYLADGKTVAMIGDGVNDAPALATSSVGIVMGAIGSDVAIEAADVALMSDDIGKLPFLFSLSRKTKNRIIFNIVISMIINFGAIILAGFGILNPVTAALVHNGGSVFVVVNSALLLTYREAKA
jgi:heavy metal translocating P-type ATPase